MELLLIKAVSVIFMVLGLSAVAEKLSPKVSGILSGLPVGSSITLVFFAVENGTSYVTDVALFNIHGLFAALSFCVGYYISTFYTGKLEIIISLSISFVFYIIIALILSIIPPHIILTPVIVIILIDLVAIYFSKKENFPIVKQDKVTISDLALRSVLTVCIFLTVTSLPNYVPTNLAGIFSAFPSILLPLLLIIHFRHSNLQARTIIKNTPFGLSSVAVYSLVVYLTYEKYGITYGTMIAFLASISYMYFQIKLFKFFNWN